jgi:hypothetical protein
MGRVCCLGCLLDRRAFCKEVGKHEYQLRMPGDSLNTGGDRGLGGVVV